MDNNIYELIYELSSIYEPEEIATKTSVTVSTVKRWIQSKSTPQPQQESAVREMYIEYMRSNNALNTAIDKCLLQLREVFHKSSRFSSRNEALEEIAKLFYAHIMSIMHGGLGINNNIIDSSRSIAESLIEFVNHQVKNKFDISFNLKIRPTEDLFAREVISIFDASLLNKQTLEQAKGTDVLNEIFGKFLADSFVDEKQLGQYLTPQEIVVLSIELLFSDLDEHHILENDFGYVLDPSCGVGSYLAAFTDKVYSLRKHESGVKQIIEKLITNNILGIDKSERMLRLALINLSMFGCQDIKLFLRNALSSKDMNIEGNVSVILTNPPFGAEFPMNEIENFKIVKEWTDNAPKKVNSELLFIEKYIDWLKPGGSLVCIVPDSILNNKGLYENLRIGISRNININAVISLPTNTFATTGTETKTSLLYLVKSTYNPSHKTYMAVCNNNGYDVLTIGSHKTKRPNNSPDLLNILHDYRNKESNYGRWVTGINEQIRWDATYYASIPVHMQEMISSSCLLRLKDVAELTKERFNPLRFERDRLFNYIEISDVDTNQMRAYGKTIPCGEAPSRARKLVRANDIVFSTVRPERGIVAVISDEQDNYVCTTGFAVLRAKIIEPMVLAYLLQTEFVSTQIKKYAMGISYPVIDENDLLEIYLPITHNDLKKHDRVAVELINKEKEVARLRKEFKHYIDETLVAV